VFYSFFVYSIRLPQPVLGEECKVQHINRPAHIEITAAAPARRRTCVFIIPPDRQGSKILKVNLSIVIYIWARVGAFNFCR